jgi:hypothetical protein
MLAGLMTLAAAAPPAASSADLPATGRSLFDRVLALQQGSSPQAVPFPFPALLDEVRRHLAPDARSDGLKLVLIPLGRSLQRNAGEAAGFFAAPRFVAAVTGEPAAGAPLLKDRLYLGYQREAAVLEVISYNEAAGRFEFQVVHDYRPGGASQVRYSRRALCLSCHQNAAPMFSRQSWDETGASPAIARLLEPHAARFAGLEWRGGVDVPNAIDDATDRANLLSVGQQVWQEGCAALGPDEAAVGCRARALIWALLQRLSHGRGSAGGNASFDEEFARPLAAAWARRWPEGLPLPDPDLPNRQPLAGMDEFMRQAPAASRLAQAADLAAGFDPLALRPPLARWRAGDPAVIDGSLRTLGLFFAVPELAALDQTLRRLVPPAEAAAQGCVLHETTADGDGRALALSCATPRLELRLKLRGTRAAGLVDRLELPGSPALRGLVAEGHWQRRGSASSTRLALSDAGLAPRTPDGRSIHAIDLSWSGAAPPDLRLHIADELPALLRAAGAAAKDTLAGRDDAFSDKPLRRGPVLAALFRQLGAPAPALCCTAEPVLPAALAEPAPAEAPADASREVATLFRNCGGCHTAPQAFPPGFLHGRGAQLAANIAACAPRMLYRLSMWATPPAARSKTPMPPPASAHAADFARSAEFAALRPWLEQQAHRSAEALLRRPYWQLAACRPNLN